MLSSRHRFHGHGSLRYLYKNGDATRTRYFIMKVAANKRRPSARLAVVISKKVLKSAVGRNRIRRRVYEALRHEIERIDPLYDIVVIVTSAELLTLDSPELHRTVVESLLRSGVYKSGQ
jgi:ribonuclease P protein component